jgi:hypothetical protein
MTKALDALLDALDCSSGTFFNGKLEIVGRKMEVLAEGQLRVEKRGADITITSPGTVLNQLPDFERWTRTKRYLEKKVGAMTYRVTPYEVAREKPVLTLD